MKMIVMHAKQDILRIQQALLLYAINVHKIAINVKVNQFA